MRVLNRPAEIVAMLGFAQTEFVKTLSSGCTIPVRDKRFSAGLAKPHRHRRRPQIRDAAGRGISSGMQIIATLWGWGEKAEAL
jgi:hypothetical protein